MGSYLSFGTFNVPPLYYLLGNGNNIDGLAPEWFSDLLIGIRPTVPRRSCAIVDQAESHQ